MTVHNHNITYVLTCPELHQLAWHPCSRPCRSLIAGGLGNPLDLMHFFMDFPVCQDRFTSTTTRIIVATFSDRLACVNTQKNYGDLHTADLQNMTLLGSHNYSHSSNVTRWTIRLSTTLEPFSAFDLCSGQLNLVQHDCPQR